MTPPSKLPPPPPAPSTTPKFKFGAVNKQKRGHRVLIYGPGGIGKTTLTCQAPGPVAYNDAEESLAVLCGQLEAAGIPLPMTIPATDFPSLRAVLQSPGWDGVKTIVLEITRIEEWVIAQTLATVKNDKGQSVSRIEDYGYGKGYQFVFDTFLPLLADLDRHASAGRNVILIAHECIKTVPNPSGEDWIRYEPRLQDVASGKGAVRLRVKEWADHVLFYGYDVVVSKESKAKGSGTRTIYTTELPHCMAKSRTTQTPIAVTEGVDVWSEIIK